MQFIFFFLFFLNVLQGFFVLTYIYINTYEYPSDFFFSSYMYFVKEFCFLYLLLCIRFFFLLLCLNVLVKGFFFLHFICA